MKAYTHKNTKNKTFKTLVENKPQKHKIKKNKTPFTQNWVIATTKQLPKKKR